MPAFREQDEEKLENLPRFEKFEDDDYWDSYFGCKLPYARLKRWMESQVGIHVDEVFHKFCNLKWLLPEYRTKDEFNRFIEVHTFFNEVGKIGYYHKYCSFHRKYPYSLVEDSYGKCLYVHPKTKIVCIFHPKTPKSYRSQWQAERDAKVRILGAFEQLYKEHGIWYHVKAEPVIDFTKTSLHDAQLGKKGANSILLEKTNENGSFVKITLKRQLSSKELKKYGLTND